MERVSGKLKWFNDVKGFGFITRDDGFPDVFVHVTAVRGRGISSLSAGQRMTFTPTEGRVGRAAVAKDVVIENQTPTENPYDER